MSASPLPVSDADLTRCVSCGLCLPRCPTWRVTGQELASPRGRIAAMRQVQWQGAPLDATFERAMEECVQCRACEPVCPSFVPFGHLMEGAREALHEQRRGRRSPARRAAEWLGYRLVLPHRAVLRVLTWLAWLAQRLRLVPRRAALPRLSVRSLARPLRPRTRPADGEGGVDREAVVFFPGCVMDAWMRDTHRAALVVIEAAGGSPVLPGRGAACCGALHLHAGRRAEAARLAERTMAATPLGRHGDAPILVDSAGCAAAMKDYGRLLGTEAAAAYAARVRDVHEWLAGRDLPLRDTGREVVIQDPCHLRNVQRVDGAVREVLGPAYRLVETGDDALCCGAGGAYAALQPRLASDIRERKVAALRRAGGPDPLVASANPGCMAHLGAGGMRVRHPVELLAEALDGRRAADRSDGYGERRER